MTRARFSLNLPPHTVDRLDALKIRTGASSATEVIKNALVTYEALAGFLESGVTFVGRRPNGEAFDVEFLIDVQRPRLVQAAEKAMK